MTIFLKVYTSKKKKVYKNKIENCCGFLNIGIIRLHINNIKRYVTLKEMLWIKIKCINKEVMNVLVYFITNKKCSGIDNYKY